MESHGEEEEDEGRSFHSEDRLVAISNDHEAQGIELNPIQHQRQHRQAEDPVDSLMLGRTDIATMK